MGPWDARKQVVGARSQRRDFSKSPTNFACVRSVTGGKAIASDS